MIMENNDDDCRVGTPKKDYIKWFCDLIEKDIRLKKEKLRNLKKDQESIVKTQDERNLYPRGGDIMWTYTEEKKPVKREIEFVTLIYSYKCTTYDILINEVMPPCDDISCGNEIYKIPIGETYYDLFIDILQYPIECGDDLYVFLNISKKKAIAMLKGKYKGLDNDKYLSILKYLNENIFTSWIFDTPNITKQLEERNNDKDE